MTQTKAQSKRPAPIKHRRQTAIKARSVMERLPTKLLDPRSWSRATVDQNERISFENINYRVDAPARTKVMIQRYWNRLVFFIERGEKQGEAFRLYGTNRVCSD